MRNILASPARSLTLGLLASVAVLSLWIAFSGVDGIGFASFLLRWLHVVSAMIWVGMIWFVNFIQLAAVGEADAAGRPAIMKLIVPRVAATFRHASHLTVASGIVLLITTGYLLDRAVFSAPVYIPPFRNLLLWGGALAALVMYGLVHMTIWPNLRIVLGEIPADEAQIAAARASIVASARWNLILVVPVTVAMVAAAHLY
ncbi:MAG: hypothetical protein AB7O43_00830 [Hyphomicrobiaceae bacterium]